MKTILVTLLLAVSLLPATAGRSRHTLAKATAYNDPWVAKSHDPDKRVQFEINRDRPGANQF